MAARQTTGRYRPGEWTQIISQTSMIAAWATVGLEKNRPVPTEKLEEIMNKLRALTEEAYQLTRGMS